MRFLITILVLIVLGGLVGPFLPWWSLAAIAILVGLWSGLAPLSAFMAGFIGGLLLWGGYAGWLDMANGGILSERMGALFGGVSGMQLVLATGVFGGTIAGLAALTGALGRAIWQ